MQSFISILAFDYFVLNFRIVLILRDLTYTILLAQGWNTNEEPF